MTENHDSSPADIEESVLMPESSPRPGLRRPKRPLAAKLAGRYNDNQSEREYAALGDQLGALEHDIHDAREVSRRSRQSLGLTTNPGFEAPAHAPRGQPVTLADGARILIRPIERDDARQLNAGFEHLSEVSRYRRFLTSIDHLSKRQLAFLTDVDHEAREALVAIDAASGEVVGVARFIRGPEDPTQAEVAVIVVDPWQHRGIGGALTERLAARARRAGVERCTARMLIGNHAGRRLLERTADDITEHGDAGTIDLIARLRT
jgi:RimJ/RimL family protein N-acetyltransferase